MKKTSFILLFLLSLTTNGFAQYDHLIEQEMIEVEVKKKDQPKQKEQIHTTTKIDNNGQSEAADFEQINQKLVLPSKYKQKGFEAQIRFNIEEGVDVYKNFSTGVDVTLGYRANEIFRFGVGTGVSYTQLLYEFESYSKYSGYIFKEYREGAATIPLFANVKFDFIKQKKCSPFLSIDLGNNFFFPASSYANRYNKMNFFFRTEVGVDIRFKKCTLCAGLSYRFQVRENYIWTNPKANYSQLCESISVQF
ncbi:MAG: hypothetical protein IKN59_09015 [Paludibacteraceae bacterium]|nr:hypothetical protein [Paludibacteraceae bacterium]